MAKSCMPPRLRWIAASAGLLATACISSGRPVFNDYEANHHALGVLRQGIAAYADTAGQLPNSLLAICPSLQAEQCHWLPFGYRFEDAWGRPFRYARVDGEYELRSLGRDGRPNTPDDVVFRPSAEQALVARAVGCYEVRLPWWPEFPGKQLVLDNTAQGRGSYAAGPAVPPYRGVAWSVTATDSIAVEWYEIHHSRQLRFQVSGDSLIGYSAIGAGMASWRGTTQRRHEVTARRTPCERSSPAG